MSDPSLSQLLADPELRRREFPIVSQKVFLAHAGVCTMPGCVARAVADYVQRAAEVGQLESLHRESESQARQWSAELMGASAEEIAFIPSTSAGLSMIAEGLDWQAGDSVVCAEGDFPANVYPWVQLQRQGVRVRQIPRRPTGWIQWHDVLAHLDERTRLVALSSINYATGAPIDVHSIGSELQARGILFCVDAIQSLGAVPFSVRHVDFLAADAHKWLLGPQGIGVLYVRRALFDRLRPVLVGWKSVQHSTDFARFQSEWADTARRYEPGTLNVLGIIGLHAALRLLRTVGIQAIADRLRALRSVLLDVLQARGFTIVGIASPDCPTGITSFHRPGEDMLPLYRKLAGLGFVTSLRPDPAGNKCIRLSPHFYNTEDEIGRLLEQL